MKTALIGLGRMGLQHLAALRSCPSAEIVALCDPALQTDHEGLPVRNLDDILADPSIAAVLIAAPTNTHETLVRQALDAGKHILCEKPLTLDPSKDLELSALADRRGLHLYVGFWRRFAAPYIAMARRIEEGAIGTLSALRLAQWDAVAPPVSFCDPDVSGGLEIDCGVHELDLIEWLLGAEIQEVAALHAQPSPEFAMSGDVETLCSLVRLDSGQVATIDLTRTAGGQDLIRTELIGQRGSIVCEIVEGANQTLRTQDGEVDQHAFTGNVISDALRGQFEAFAEAVVSGTPSQSAATAEAAARALAAGEAVRRSRVNKGRWCQPERPRVAEPVPC